GFFRNLMLLSPAPTTDQLIDIAFTSEYPDEISAAATRLYIEEHEEQKEYRQKLIDRLLQVDFKDLDKTKNDRLKTIVLAGQLTDRVNKRYILHKHFSEIQADANFFNIVTDKAEYILNLL
ncbi:MAG: hypothetical protein Q7J86_00510, partial [Bacteroidota bacterium]|nr:hypothetical protein [Bacteroidota bacterium]